MWINLRKKVYSIANVVNDPERRYWINRLKRKVGHITFFVQYEKKKLHSPSPAVKKSFEWHKLFEKSEKMGLNWKMSPQKSNSTISSKFGAKIQTYQNWIIWTEIRLLELCALFVASFWHYFFIIMMLCRIFAAVVVSLK